MNEWNELFNFAAPEFAKGGEPPRPIRLEVVVRCDHPDATMSEEDIAESLRKAERALRRGDSPSKTIDDLRAVSDVNLPDDLADSPAYALEFALPVQTQSFRAAAICRVVVPDGVLWGTASGDDSVDEAGLPITPTLALAGDLDGAIRLARLFLKTGRRRD